MSQKALKPACTPAIQCERHLMRGRAPNWRYWLRPRAYGLEICPNMAMVP